MPALKSYLKSEWEIELLESQSARKLAAEKRKREEDGKETGLEGERGMAAKRRKHD
jgi:hypothetical protein